jgi:hypothetical protein
MWWWILWKAGEVGDIYCEDEVGRRKAESVLDTVGFWDTHRGIVF